MLNRFPSDNSQFELRPYGAVDNDKDVCFHPAGRYTTSRDCHDNVNFFSTESGSPGELELYALGWHLAPGPTPPPTQRPTQRPTRNAFDFNFGPQFNFMNSFTDPLSMGPPLYIFNSVLNKYRMIPLSEDGLSQFMNPPRQFVGVPVIFTSAVRFFLFHFSAPPY